MQRIHTIERALYGQPESNHPGLLERQNVTDRTARTIALRLNQLAFMVVSLVVAAVVQLVLVRSSTQKIENALPPSINNPTKP